MAKNPYDFVKKNENPRLFSFSCYQSLSSRRYYRTRPTVSCGYCLPIVLPWIREIQPQIREILRQTDINNSVARSK